MPSTATPTATPSAATTAPALPLDARHLAKRYGARQAVADVSLQVAPGMLLGLLGPNGAGKSTTLAMVAGLTPADGGSVRIAGHDQASQPAAARRHIGLVTQELALVPALSARRNLLLFGALHGLRGAALASRADTVLAQVGLADRAGDRPDTFSGGMQRRLHIACALVHDPDLLLLDEPTAGVDPQSRLAIFAMLETLRAAGKALVYTTHHMDEVERLADQVVIIDHGRVVAEGTVAALRQRLPGRQRLDIALAQPADAALLAALRGLPGVHQAEAWPEGLQVVLAEAAAPGAQGMAGGAAAVLGLLAGRSVVVQHLASQRATLEDVFIDLTGHQLRDGSAAPTAPPTAQGTRP